MTVRCVCGRAVGWVDACERAWEAGAGGEGVCGVCACVRGGGRQYLGPPKNLSQHTERPLFDTSQYAGPPKKVRSTQDRPTSFAVQGTSRNYWIDCREYHVSSLHF